MYCFAEGRERRARIDRMADRLPHLDIAERRLLVGHVEQRVLPAGCRLDDHVVRALEDHGLVARHVVGQMNVAAPQPGDDGGRVLDVAELDPVDRRLALVIVLERLEHDAARIAVHEPVGAGADGVGSDTATQLLDMRLVADVAAFEIADELELVIGLLHPHLDRQFVESDSLVHIDEHVELPRPLVRVGDAIEGKGDILRGDGRAVVEFGAFAQRVAVGQRVRVFPGHGQARMQHAGHRVLPHQRVVDLSLHVDRGESAPDLGIEGAYLFDMRDHERVPLGPRLDDPRQDQRRGADRGAGTEAALEKLPPCVNALHDRVNGGVVCHVCLPCCDAPFRLSYGTCRSDARAGLRVAFNPVGGTLAIGQSTYCIAATVCPAAASTMVVSRCFVMLATVVGTESIPRNGRFRIHDDTIREPKSRTGSAVRLGRQSKHG